jgi:ATP-dependent helicase/nuclease subunit B
MGRLAFRACCIPTILHFLAPPVSHSPLFERLARQGTDHPIVVTSTRRLARTLGREFDDWCAGRGLRVWETPEILPFAAFIARLHEAARHDPALTGVRAPLSDGQEKALWEAVVADSDVPLASTTAAAELAAEGWALAHQWQIADRLRYFALTEDTRVFAGWASEFERRVETIGAIDQARLPDTVRELVDKGELRGPAEVILAGFDELTPQQAALLKTFEARGSRCDLLSEAHARGRQRRAEASDGRDEVERMADWAAGCLAANPGARIGVVVPDLAARRHSIVRSLDAGLEPDALLAAPDRLRPYSISLGCSLAEAPIVATALLVLRIAAGDVPWAEASSLLRSPFVNLGPCSARDRFDADWRRRSGRTASLADLLAVARAADDEHTSGPRGSLEALQAWRQRAGARARRLSEWTALLGEALRSVGFPGPEPLDSVGYQTLVRWQELLAEFAALERVQGQADLRSAVYRLRRLAASTLFQPEGGDPPVQVVGLLETAGLTFDHLWLMGLTAEAWPPPARPHPLLPLELQRAKCMPGALVERELHKARAMLERLIHAADDVVVSHATREGDRALKASPMIADWPEWIPPARVPRALDAITPVPLEMLVDAAAPALAEGRVVGGGTSTLTDQAACPFRAFANHRLAAEEPQEPHDGFDASERGQLVHQVLARFWQTLPERTRQFVAAMPASERQANLERAADQALRRMEERRLGRTRGALAALERRRLVDLGSRWLQYEIEQRQDFEVLATEERRALAIGPLSLNGRIDRIDRLADGRTIVIDYKTGGNAGVRSWLGPRPDEPQLPLYLVASEQDARAVAFARVRAGETRFVALAEDPGLLPGARTDWSEEHATWRALVEAWSRELASLARDFADGVAEVAPKRRVQTCRNCGLGPLCRLHERAPDDDTDASEGVLDER